MNSRFCDILVLICKRFSRHLNTFYEEHSSDEECSSVFSYGIGTYPV